MTSDNATLMRTWFDELWNRGHEEIIDRMLTDETLVYGLGPAGAADKPLRGAVEYRQFYKAFRSAIPDVHVTVEDTVSERDRVAVRCRVTGTHRGDGLGFPATGHRIDFSGICIVRVAQGRFVEAWNHFDFLQCYQQLGVLPTDLNRKPELK